jgi:hypothetical protein
MKYTSVKAIANDWLTQMDFSGKIKPEILYRYANNAADILIGSESVVYRVAMVDVDNMVGTLPKDIHTVTLAACVSNEAKYVNRGYLTSYTQKVFGSDCEIEVNLNCPSCHKEACNCSTPVLEIDIDNVWLGERPYLKNINDHNLIGWAAASTEGFPTWSMPPEFQVMKPRVSTDILWNSEYFLGVCNALGANNVSNYSYQLEDDKFITDLKKGQVMLGYLAYKRDADGYLMIPDVVEAVEAVIAYITMQTMWRMWMNSGNQNDRLRWLDAQNKSNAIMGEAKGKLEMPTADKWERILKERYVVDRDRYFY